MVVAADDQSAQAAGAGGGDFVDQSLPFGAVGRRGPGVEQVVAGLVEHLGGEVGAIGDPVEDRHRRHQHVVATAARLQVREPAAQRLPLFVAEDARGRDVATGALVHHEHRHAVPGELLPQRGLWIACRRPELTRSAADLVVDEGGAEVAEVAVAVDVLVALRTPAVADLVVVPGHHRRQRLQRAFEARERPVRAIHRVEEARQVVGADARSRLRLDRPRRHRMALAQPRERVVVAFDVDLVADAAQPARLRHAGDAPLGRGLQQLAHRDQRAGAAAAPRHAFARVDRHAGRGDVERLEVADEQRAAGRLRRVESLGARRGHRDLAQHLIVGREPDRHRLARGAIGRQVLGQHVDDRGVVGRIERDLARGGAEPRLAARRGALQPDAGRAGELAQCGVEAWERGVCAAGHRLVVELGARRHLRQVLRHHVRCEFQHATAGQRHRERRRGGSADTWLTARVHARRGSSFRPARRRALFRPAPTTPRPSSRRSACRSGRSPASPPAGTSCCAAAARSRHP